LLFGLLQTVEANQHRGIKQSHHRQIRLNEEYPLQRRRGALDVAVGDLLARELEIELKIVRVLQNLGVFDSRRLQRFPLSQALGDPAGDKHHRHHRDDNTAPKSRGWPADQAGPRLCFQARWHVIVALCFQFSFQLARFDPSQQCRSPRI